MSDLWALLIEGPDSVLAMPSKEEAEARAAELNAEYETYKSQPGAQAEYIARWNAVVAPWPFSAEAHAEELTNEDDDA